MLKQIIYRLKLFVKSTYNSIRPSNFENSLLKDKNRNIFIFFSGDYGNLGDYAITKAQIDFLKKIYTESNFILVGASKPMSDYKKIKSNIKKEDIITLVGGGNLGDLYPEFEEKRQYIVKLFKNNYIISFPQTVDYSQSPIGQVLLKRAQKIYNQHNKLVLCAREKKSFDLLKGYFQNPELLLVPDIVLSLNVDINNEKFQNTIVTCFRDDKEKVIDNSIKNIINNFSNENKFKVIETDTHIGKDNITELQLESEFQLLLNDFSKASLVITDRLHGMIIAYLVGTPCLFFDNTNNKVSGVSRWIESSSLVKQTYRTSIKTDIMNMMCFQEHKKIDLTDEFSSLEQLLTRIAQ